MRLRDWMETVPETMTGDPLWKIKVYPLAVFAGEVGWQDVTRLMQDKRTLSLSDQLYRALGSISANIAEGYSRSSHKDQARMYEYALGSARESRDWYYKARHVLGEQVVEQRLAMLTEVIKYLLVMIPDVRGTRVSEEQAPYAVDPYNLDIFNNVPLPD